MQGGARWRPATDGRDLQKTTGGDCWFCREALGIMGSWPGLDVEEKAVLLGVLSPWLARVFVPTRWCCGYLMRAVSGRGRLAQPEGRLLSVFLELDLDVVETASGAVLDSHEGLPVPTAQVQI